MKTCFSQAFVFFFVLVSLAIPGTAQDFSFKYEKVTPEELSLTTYEADTTAGAFVIYKKGVSNYEYINNEFRLKHVITTKIKILSTEGYKYADVTIPYYKQRKDAESTESVSDIEAFSYNFVDGKVVKTKMPKNYIFRERINDGYMQVKFTIPNVKAGTVIEYKYGYISDFFHLIDDWEMQQEIPVVYSEYDITIPDFFQFNMLQWGVEKIEHVRSKKTVVYNSDSSYGGASQSIRCPAHNFNFKAKNLPALKDEPLLWCADDYKSKIHFELYGVQFPGNDYQSFAVKWEDVDKVLLKNNKFGKLLDFPNPFREDVRNLNLKGLSNEQKVVAVYRLLKQKLAWDDTYRLYGKDLEKVIKAGTGSNADLNFILISMLRDAGILSYPVVLGRRNMGAVPKEYPSITKLNTFIVGIMEGDKWVFLDSSIENGYLNILPPSLMVEHARVINTAEGDKWVDLSKSGNNYIKLFIKGKMGKEGVLTANSTTEFSGQYTVNMRSRFKSAKDSTDFIKQIENDRSISVRDYKHEGYSDFTPTIRESIDFTKQVNSNEEYIYLNPLIFPHTLKNQFIQANRKLPIELDYPYTMQMIVTMELPDGYVIEEMPKQSRLSMGEGRMSCQYLLNIVDNTIQLSYLFSQKELRFSEEEYTDLQLFWSEVVEKNSEVIVLKRASE